MPVQPIRILMCAIAMLCLWNSFPAFANPDEKELEACQGALDGSNTLVPHVEFKLTSEFNSQGATALFWQPDLDGGGPSWLNAIDFASGRVRTYQPPLSAVPGRVRIMPVGKAPPIVNVREPQVTRDASGRVFLLLPRESGQGAEIFSLSGGVLSPVAVIPTASARLYSGLGDRPWVAWQEESDGKRMTVKAALLEGLTSPALSFVLDDGESALDFVYDRDSDSRGQFAVLTDKRILLFTNSSN